MLSHLVVSLPLRMFRSDYPERSLCRPPIGIRLPLSQNNTSSTFNEDTFEISLFIICYESCNGSKRRRLLVLLGTCGTISMVGLTTLPSLYVGLA